jgi:hypothetical protein
MLRGKNVHDFNGAMKNILMILSAVVKAPVWLKLSREDVNALGILKNSFSINKISDVLLVISYMHSAGCACFLGSYVPDQRNVYIHRSTVVPVSVAVRERKIIRFLALTHRVLV